MIKTRLELPICPWACQDMVVSIWRDLTVETLSDRRLSVPSFGTTPCCCMLRRYNQNEPPSYVNMLHHADIGQSASPILSCPHDLMWPSLVETVDQALAHDTARKWCYDKRFAIVNAHFPHPSGSQPSHPSKVSLPKQNESLGCGNFLADGLSIQE